MTSTQQTNSTRNKTTLNTLIRRLDNTSPTILNLLIFSIGLILILIGALATSIHNEWRVSAGGVGTSLISTAIVAYLTSRYIQRREERDIMLESWGIAGIYKTRALMNEALNPFISETRSIDISAFGLKNFRSHKGAEIKQQVKNGLTLRILAPNPESPFVIERNKDENNSEGQLSQEITELIEWCQTLRNINKACIRRVDIRIYNRPPLDFYFRVDGLLCVGPYLYKRPSQQTISYTFTPTSLGYEYWKNHFEELWDDESFCKSALQSR